MNDEILIGGQQGARDLAKVVRLERLGNRFTLTIDGEPFPYYLDRQPIVTTTSPDGIGIVMLPLIAERVEIVDDLGQ